MFSTFNKSEIHSVEIFLICLHVSHASRNHQEEVFVVAGCTLVNVKVNSLPTNLHPAAIDGIAQSESYLIACLKLDANEKERPC